VLNRRHAPPRMGGWDAPERGLDTADVLLPAPADKPRPGPAPTDLHHRPRTAPAADRCPTASNSP